MSQEIENAEEKEKPGVPIPLSHLKAGERGKIVAISASGSLRQRLLSLGFSRGAEIQHVKFAPLGDPIQYRLRGASISLRCSEAEQIAILISSGTIL